jgi:hypothetical protein
LLFGFGAISVSAQESRKIDGYIWKKDIDSGKELSASRSDHSFNFFDVGDLSYYSQYLVEQDLRRISAVARLTIDHTPAKNSSVLIVHDTNVFERLKNDKPAFKALGFSDDLITMLEKQVKSDSPKCLTMTITDEKNNITSTVVLLSAKFDGCLTSAMLSAFGVVAPDIGTKALIDICVLYEARRLDIRDRESFAQEGPRLRNLCIASAG